MGRSSNVWRKSVWNFIQTRRRSCTAKTPIARDHMTTKIQLLRLHVSSPSGEEQARELLRELLARDRRRRQGRSDGTSAPGGSNGTVKWPFKDLATMINPIVHGLDQLLRELLSVQTGSAAADRLNADLASWAIRKYKRLRHHFAKAFGGCETLQDETRLSLLTGGLAHALTAGRWEPDDREAHVRFCESRGVRFPPATRPPAAAAASNCTSQPAGHGNTTSSTPSPGYVPSRCAVDRRAGEPTPTRGGAVSTSSSHNLLYKVNGRYDYDQAELVVRMRAALDAREARSRCPSRCARPPSITGLHERSRSEVVFKDIDPKTP